MLKTRSTILFATAIAILALGSTTANAAPGPLGLNWTASQSGNVYGASSTTTVTSYALSYSYDNGYAGPGVPPMTYTFSTQAASAGTESVAFLWSNFAAWYQAYNTLSLCDFTSSNCQTLSTDYDINNTPITTSIAVNAGDIWGFQIYTGNFDSTSILNGSLAFPTPEPSSLALLGSGLAAVAGVVRRKFMA